MANNQVKCGDYSLLFSMRADDNEQHFNYWWPNLSLNTGLLAFF